MHFHVYFLMEIVISPKKKNISAHLKEPYTYVSILCIRKYHLETRNMGNNYQLNLFGSSDFVFLVS